MKRLFTSESVTEGHPDKICDQISDSILDAILAKDPNARVACETCTTTGMVMVMGEISTNLSDYVIFTSDNPRSEKIIDIINDMIEGIQKNNYEIIENRESAIIRGIQLMGKSDILLILGKGHEEYQIIGNKKYDFSDQEIVQKNI